MAGDGRAFSRMTGRRLRSGGFSLAGQTRRRWNQPKLGGTSGAAALGRGPAGGCRGKIPWFASQKGEKDMKKGRKIGILAAAAACLLISCGTGRETADEGAERSASVFVEGYGLVNGSKAPVLVPEKTPEPLETDGAKAWLCGAFYQDGQLGVRVFISADREPEEDAAAVLADAEAECLGTAAVQAGTETGHLDEAAEQPETRTGGGGPFQRRRENWKKEHPVWEGFYWGEEDRTFSFHSAAVGQFEIGEKTDGRNAVTVEGLCETGSSLPGDGFSGEIRLDGFETGFPVTFVPAQEAEELVEGEWACFAADGKEENGRLSAAVYTIPREGEAVLEKLTAVNGGGQETELTKLWGPSNDGRCPERLEGSFSVWSGKIPGNEEKAQEKGDEVVLRAEETWVYLDEEPETVKIPVPETSGETADMDQTVQLENGEIHFGRVERMGELEPGEDGEEPEISLSAEINVTPKDDKFRLVSFYGIRPGTVREEEENYTWEGLCLAPDQDGGYEEPLKRVRVICEEGEREVEAVLTGFTYLWTSCVEMPLKE